MNINSGQMLSTEGGLKSYIEGLEGDVTAFLKKLEEDHGEFSFDEEIFRKPILESLFEMGGRGRRPEVRFRVEQKLHHILTATPGLRDWYYDTLSQGEERWAGQVDFVRNTLADEGLISRAEWGVWQLTDKGVEAANDSAKERKA